MVDVAQRAGVSLSTVSHVLNDTRRVNPETRQRVEDAVAALGYRRNSVARTLAGGSSHTIGLAISGLTNPYFGPLLHAIERRVSAADHVLVLGDTHDEPEMEVRVIESLLERRVDGLIVAPSAGFLPTAERIAATGTPLVLIDRSMDLDCDQVIPENTESVRRLASHLIEHGHRRIAAVVGLPGLDSSADREKGFRAALAAHGIPVDERLVVGGESNSETSALRVAELMKDPDPPTALVTLNNAMTIGALRAVKDAGRSIPGDVAVAAYDDFEWSDLFEPGLTAMAQDVARMGREAVDLLMSRIGGSTEPHERRVIETTFHRRTSCGCPPTP
ncbi:LacI family DNA-binding transcriptional regulator [Microbacterium sp.]|uniref:LacI family DNA-binding transcriptional regulator n=1 Tax=Microbacterium sp. TaxID=51671 RepID=UPI0028120562|nr:LacI family DNA-binding transcriptional regulator [Microbacterium sp.]